MPQQIRLILLVLLSVTFVPVASFAADEPPGITALLDAMEAQYKAAGGDRPVYESIEPDGNGGAVLHNLKFSMKTPDMAMATITERIVIKGVSQRASGGYSFESMVSTNTILSVQAQEIDPFSVTIPVFSASNAHILAKPKDGETDYSVFMGKMIYEIGTIPLMTINVAGQSFNATNFKTIWSGDRETGLGKWDISLASVAIPTSTIPEPSFQKDMKEVFGIETIDFGFDGSVSLIAKGRSLDLAYGIRLKGKKIGEFEFAIAGQDIPTALGGVLQEIQGGKEPNIGKLMPLIIGIKFAKLKLRFVDDNFAAKMLALAAKKEGTTVETMTANGAALIQIGLGQLGVPEFTKSVVAAYNAFVENPQNISLEASPQDPVALATLMGMMAAPGAAIKMLGVKVEANK